MKSLFGERLGFLNKRWGLPFLLAILTLVSFVVVYGIVTQGIGFGIGAILLVVGIPVLMYSVADLRFGVTVFMLIAFVLMGVYRFVKVFQLGMIIDLFLAFMLLGLLFHQRQARTVKLADNPVSVAVWIWIGYNMLEFLNPNGVMEAWIFVIRTVASWMVFYFIVLSVMDNLSFMKRLIHLWIVMATIGALYGLFQEFHGMLGAELEWINRDELRHKLYFNWGRYRIFSFFNDPTVFGMLMSFSALFCATLLAGPFSLRYKFFLATAAGLMLLAMVYTGTRTAYAMFPAGFLFYALLTFQWRTLALTAFAGLIGAFIVFSDIKSLGPFLSTNNLQRIRSTFNPSEDPSFQLREQRQALIKPYIQGHPIGAGLGSIGVWGNRFNVGSPIGGFAPDSGYVRVAVETGWIGLLVYCGFLATVLIVGIKNYFCLRNKMLKAYVGGLLAVVYAIAIGNYPQQALILAPNVFIFYAIMAMVVNSRKIDRGPLEQKANNQEENLE